ncbi:uncharacterized protein PV07_03829 [Cladophialophora immunda]|uniref:CHAT domain-containing protein n=1 Tax=Cladophialophora immunda TaxID=569365 RepID=A0A0D2D964_9EURO|nr:uncharacterized protein PV07_03829 [Cladophialophora immunda]KIW32269.1 hypothetical protein PV07_03829 [Cladophialophora immunda]
MSQTQFMVIVEEAPSSEEGKSHNVRVGCKVYSKSGEQLSQGSIIRNLPISPLLLSQEISWAIQGYVKDPFQSHRAELAFKNFKEHGKFLTKKLNLVGCLEETCGPVLNVTEVDIQLNIVDSTTDTNGNQVSNSLQGIPWEMLESPQIASAGPRIHVRRVLDGSSTGKTHTIEKLNVLLVTSRSSERADIPHRVVSLPLFSILHQLDNRFVDVRLLRPGTLDAFSHALKVGKYDMVHFDLHGKVADFGHGQRPYLFFDGQAVEGAVVATLLKSREVRLVTLNACQSAFLQGDCQTNLAAMLMGDSVEAVVAMSHEITPAAVGIFLRSFYQSLLVDGQDMVIAVTKARRALEVSKQRDSAFGFPVCLDDYTVPLLYQASAGEIRVRVPKKEPATNRSNTVSSLLSDQSVFGRDQQILLLESYLIKSKVAALTAFEGEGRATLLSCLKPWWIITNFVQGVLHIDFRTTPSCWAGGGSEPPTIETICQGLVEFRPGLAEKPTPAELTIDFLRNNRYLVLLENTDYLKPRPTAKSKLGKALNGFTSAFFDPDFASLLLITSTSTEAWASCRVREARRKPRYHSLTTDYFDQMKVATGILGWGGPEIHGSSGFRYLHHIIQLCSYHPLAMRTLLPRLFATGSSARDLFWKLQISPMHLDWDSGDLSKLCVRFAGACEELGAFLSIFIPIHSACTTDYIRLHIHRNLDTIPWASRPELESEQRVSCAMEYLLMTLRDCGIARFSDWAYAEKIQLHPLFCIYLRDRVFSSSQCQQSFRSLAMYHHNCARRWAQEDMVSPVQAPDCYAHQYLAHFGALHFILKHPELSEADRRTFDLPWIMATVYCGKTREALWEEEEVVSDLAHQALPFFVPGLKWVENKGCHILNAALLHSRSRIMPLEDCLLVLQLLQWVTLHYFRLSTPTARHANSYISLILENKSLLAGEADEGSALLRFIKAVSGLAEAEMGGSRLNWAQADYGAVYEALQHTDELGIDPVQLLFLQTWDQDFRFRLNWYQLDIQTAKENISNWQHTEYFVKSALDERLVALNDDSAYIKAIQHLRDRRPDLYQDERSALLRTMRDSSERSEVDRLLHTLYCLLSMSEEEKDWKACLDFLDRIETTELDIRNKPGYVEGDREKHSSEAWRCRIRARCYRNLGDDNRSEKYKCQSMAAADHANRLRTEHDRFLESQQANRQRLLFDWSINSTQDRPREINDFFTRPDVRDVPIPQEDLEEDREYDRGLDHLLRAVEPLGGSGPMRRIPVNPQPLNSSYLQRPFLIAARWLTVSRYLCVVTGREESPTHRLPSFDRIGTGMDLLLDLESMQVRVLVQDLKSNGFDPKNLTTTQFLKMMGLD